MVSGDYREWRPGFEPANEGDVRSLLQHIRNHNGTVSDEDRKDTANFGPLSLSIIAELKASKIADVEFLSREIYSSGSRFLYEVIQNADDNRYTKLTGSDERPQLSITLTKDKLIFENNEDGFTRANIQAISQTRKSTKTTTLDQEQIGEKGIGFKAVFAVANKVHIQSGIYSFSFRYHRGEEEGVLGMIAPMKESNEDMPTAGTRITLTDFCDVDFHDLRHQLEELPDPLLLLLRQLRSLAVRIDDGQQVLEISWSRKITNDSGFTEILKSSSVSRKGEPSEVIEKSEQLKDIYYMQTRLFVDLPNDPARQIGGTGQYINHAKVVLAFPLDQEMRPRIENQFSYAFLPMRKFGFSFIIQSDFITQANREDVQYSSKRNKALLARASQVFCDAVEEMCKHESLRYTWMRFLPGTVSSDFWLNLEPIICRDLRTRSILEPFQNSPPLSNVQELIPLCKPGPFHIIPSWFLDNDENPLLNQTNQIQYLSLAYSPEDRSRLKSINVQELNWPRILDLLKEDLKNSNSRWCSLDYDTDWQTQVSKLLTKICSSKTDGKRLRSLSVVKLLGGGWIAPSSIDDLYMPTTGPADVPSDIGLSLIDPKSMKTSSRASLMKELGIKHAAQSMVIQKIESTHSKERPYRKIHEGIIHFLYLFWHGPETLPQPLRARLQFVREPNRFTHLNVDVFIPLTGDDLGPEKLFKKTSRGLVQADGFSDAFFLHKSWVDNNEVNLMKTNCRGQTWENWLSTTVGLRKQPRLLQFGGVITKEFEYLMEYRPDITVLLMHRHRSEWMPVAPRLVLEFNSMKVLCEGDTLVRLSESILTTTKLRQLASSFGISKLPFILLQGDLQDTELHEWTFLKQFKVITDECLDFYIKCIMEIDPVSKGHSEDDVFKIYTKIESLCTREDKSRLGKQLDGCVWIWIPAIGDTDAKWVKTQDCRWKGPSWLTCKYTLQNIEQYKGLEFLMHTIIQLPDATWGDSIAQLKEMKTKSSNSTNVDTIKTIYESLWAEFSQDKLGTWLRDEFETHALIWTASAWLAPSECVWAPDKIKVEGKVSIQDVYNSQKSLTNMFVNGLKIPKPSLEMHIASLAKLEKTHGSKADIIDVMEHIASLKRPDGELKTKLQGLNIFSIRQGYDYIRASLSAEFAIIDKPIFRKYFGEKIHVLDFSDHDFWRTKEFLTACGLSNRFMSECLVEKTSAFNAVPFELRTNDLRSKAYAFTRYAVHCRSTKTQDSHHELYECLQNISILKSDDIRRSLSITQSLGTHTALMDKVGVHFDEGDSLKIYVPADPRDLKRCWPIDVIPRLKKWLGVSHPFLDNVLQQIFIQDDLEILDEDLEKIGIITVEGLERPRSIMNLAMPSDEDFRSTVSNTLTALRPHAANSYGSSPSYESHSQYRRQSFGYTQNEPNQNDIDIYREILDEIIHAARSKPIRDRHYPQPPRLVSLNTHRLLSAFGPTFINRSRNMHRDRRVGAAGELFIFEFLKKLQLPGFDLKNWRSTIRDEVKVHQNYAGLSAFTGRETSDIVYQDTSGALTKILCDSHYLDPTIWLSEMPEYLIEVKTTTEACEDPFYVSMAQYKLMNDMGLTEGQVKSKVYLIIRVFNLGQAEEMDYRIYLDPWSAKERGELQFTTNNWKVEPTRSAGGQETQSDNPASGALGESTPHPNPSTPSQWQTFGLATPSSNVWSSGGFGSGFDNAATGVSSKASSLFSRSVFTQSSSFTQQQKPPPTNTKPYVVTSSLELVPRDGTLRSLLDDFQSITHMPEYRRWSFEELRLNDYACGLHMPSSSEEALGSSRGFGPQVFRGFGG